MSIPYPCWVSYVAGGLDVLLVEVQVIERVCILKWPVMNSDGIDGRWEKGMAWWGGVVGE